MQKERGAGLSPAPPGTSPVSISLCLSSDHDRYVGRGQRQPAACHKLMHTVRKGKHRHNKVETRMLLRHNCRPLFSQVKQ